MSRPPAPAVSLSPERMARFREYAAEYPNLRSALMMTLRLAEEEFGSITDEAMALVPRRSSAPSPTKPWRWSPTSAR